MVIFKNMLLFFYIIVSFYKHLNGNIFKVLFNILK